MAFSDLLAVGDLALRNVLGAPITYAPTVGSPRVVQGIFDAAYVVVDGPETGISSTSPAVFLALSDLPAAIADDLTATVTVGGTTYRIHEVKPDGVNGGVVLLLHLAS